MPILTGKGVKLEYRDFGLTEITKRIAELRGTRLYVGVVGPRASELTEDGRLTNAENAAIQQYGLAPKHYTKRDFLKGPFTRERSRVSSILRRVAGRVLRLQMTPEQSLDEAGYELERIVLEAIDAHVKPENAPATVEKKGFNHPLVETNNLSNAISHRIVRGSGDVLEAGSTVDDFQAFEISGLTNPNSGKAI